MKFSFHARSAAVIALSLTFIASIAVFAQDKPVEKPAAAPSAATAATPEAAPAFDQQAALAKLRESIKGHEEEQADKVFKNIQSLNKVPAGRLLMIMEMGYNGSLGVTCTHCHNPNAWDSDEKPEKKIARAMMAMTHEINGKLLPAIPGLKSEKPMVSCTTCHRGQVKPATSMNQPPAAK